MESYCADFHAEYRMLKDKTDLRLYYSTNSICLNIAYKQKSDCFNNDACVTVGTVTLHHQQRFLESANYFSFTEIMVISLIGLFYE